MRIKVSLWAVLVAVTMEGMLSSCSKENDSEASRLKYVTFKFKYEISEDLFGVAKVTAMYYDENGKIQIDTFKTTQWTKTIVAKTLPVKTGYRIYIERNDSSLSSQKPWYNFMASFQNRADINMTDEVKTFDGVKVTWDNSFFPDAVDKNVKEMSTYDLSFGYNAKLVGGKVVVEREKIDF